MRGLVVPMTHSYSNAYSEITVLLAALRGPERNTAWRVFMERYSPLIHHLCARTDSDVDRAGDCFLFVCEKLVDDDFGRLMNYRPDMRSSFKSWLKVVVANLCIDWRRQQSGRLRNFRCVEELSETDQQVFRLYFLERRDRSACQAALQAYHPNWTEKDLSGSLGRINRLMTQHQRWLLFIRHARTDSLDDEGGLQPLDPLPEPENVTEAAQWGEWLDQALRQLPSRQRMLLRLRFEQGLTYREIARLTRLGDPYRARRRIDAAVLALRTLLEESTESRKSRKLVR